MNEKRTNGRPLTLEELARELLPAEFFSPAAMKFETSEDEEIRLLLSLRLKPATVYRLLIGGVVLATAITRIPS